MNRPLLEVDRLHVRYGDSPDAAAIEDVTFAVAAGELLSIVGPSGSGKTTLLRCIGGLLAPTAGRVLLDGAPVTDVPDSLAIVFQEYGRSLFPWMRVEENVELPLRSLGLDAEDRRDRIGSALAEVGLADAARRYPWQLSGGMQQRVAIARAIAYRPRILLMDEPFGSVDAQARADLQDMLLEIWRTHGTTVLFVTHDIDESVYLSGRVIVLSRPPATVAADVPITLPRPRDQIETRASPGFVERRAEVARLIHRGPAGDAGQR